MTIPMDNHESHKKNIVQSFSTSTIPPQVIPPQQDLLGKIIKLVARRIVDDFLKSKVVRMAHNKNKISAK